jgi:UDP-glucose 4-epimerase
MIIVTGAAGFIGSAVCRKLSEQGLAVIGIDDLSFGYEKNIPKGIHFEKIGFESFVRNGYAGKYAFSEEDIMIHLATANIVYAQSHPVETFKVNAEKTIEFLKSIPGKIIYTSTSSIYGNPEYVPTFEEAEINTSNAYDSSKRSAELFLQKRGNYTTLRLTNVYGPYQRPENPYCGVIGKLIDSAYKGKAFPVYGDGTDTRDYTYVDDVVDAIISAACIYPARNTEINIGTGIETSVNDLIKAVEQESGKSVMRKQVTGRPIDTIRRRCLFIDKATLLLRYEPKTPITDGIKKTIEWYKANYK